MSPQTRDQRPQDSGGHDTGLAEAVRGPGLHHLLGSPARPSSKCPCSPWQNLPSLTVWVQREAAENLHGLWGQKEHWAQFTGRDTGCCALPRAVGARVPRQLGSRPLGPIMPRGCGVALPQSQHQRQRQRRRCWKRSWGGHDHRSTKELAGNWEAPHFLLCKGPVRSAHHACGEGLFKAAALREQCVVETFWKVQAPERR